MSRVIANYLEQANKLADRGVVFATITLVQPEGHVPQDIGAKAIVTESGLAWAPLVVVDLKRAPLSTRLP